MRTRAWPLWVLLGALVAAACTPLEVDEEVGQLKSRASFDFDCPKSSIKTVTIDDRTKGVTGCGRRAVYVQTCARPLSTIDQQCTWVMNTERNRKKTEADDTE
jgi:hypothetical protein